MRQHHPKLPLLLPALLLANWCCCIATLLLLILVGDVTTLQHVSTSSRNRTPIARS
jgi:hypothetical protein